MLAFVDVSKLIIDQVDVWNADGVLKNQIVSVQNGKIESILPSPQPALMKPKVLMPAGVDAQTHLRVPGQAHKETPLSGLRAALAGGYAAVLAMPNTKPVIDCVDVCHMAMSELREAQNETGVRAYLSAAMTIGQEGGAVVDMEALAAWGVKAFTDDGRGVAQDAVMEAVLQRAQHVPLPLLQHAEVPGHGGVLAPGPTQEKLGLKAYPASAEVDMVRRDLALLKRYPKARYHVLHISAPETFRLVVEAKKNALLVSSEVTPHHLYFASEDIPLTDTSFKMNPPLRSRREQEELITALQNGLIDFVSTDHAPHETAMKGQDFRAAAFGTGGLETTFRVLSHLYVKGLLTERRFVEVFSKKPAEFLGIQDDVGVLKVGRMFKAILCDPTAKATTVEARHIHSLSKNNCFIGATLPGSIEAVYL